MKRPLLIAIPIALYIFVAANNRASAATVDDFSERVDRTIQTQMENPSGQYDGVYAAKALETFRSLPISSRYQLMQLVQYRCKSMRQSAKGNPSNYPAAKLLADLKLSEIWQSRRTLEEQWTEEHILTAAAAVGDRLFCPEFR